MKRYVLGMVVGIIIGASITGMVLAAGYDGHLAGLIEALRTVVDLFTIYIGSLGAP